MTHTAVRDVPPDRTTQRKLHQTIQKVTEDLEGMRFNTAISAMMEFTNYLTPLAERPRAVLEPFVLWRIAPSVAIETTAKVKTGKEDEWAGGFRFKGNFIKNFDYSAEWITERGSDGTNAIQAWATT